VVARFREENPNVTVNLRTYPEYTPIIEGLQASLAAQEPPAMAHVGWPWLRYASAALPHPTVEETAESAGRPTGWLEENFAPNILDLARVDGAVQGVPLIMGEPGLHFNKDIFREAGLDRAPRTWDEVREYARRISESTDAIGLYVGEYEDFYNEQGMIESNGGRMLVESGGGFRTGVGEPEAVEALQYLADMVLGDETAEHGEPEQGQQSFLSGRIAMFGTSTAAYSGLQKSASFDLGVARFPTFGGKTPRLPVGGACNMVFAADPKQRGAAIELARFMSTPESFTTFVKETALLPGRNDLFDDPQYLKAFREEDPAMRVSAQQFQYAAPFASWPGEDGLEALKVLRDARSRFLSGEQDVEEAMVEAAERIDGLINT
jgi:multiple sugar transport system substrate-binding protein